MLEEQVSEERGPDMNEEEDTRMEDTREEHQSDDFEDGEDKSKIQALRWDIYTRYKEELINRQLPLSVPHPKGGNIVWTCVKENIFEEKEDYESIGLRCFDYKLFESNEGKGVREELDGYPYLMHINKLWPGDWVKQMTKTNQAVGGKNRLDTSVGRKWPIHPFTSNELWKCIG